MALSRRKFATNAILGLAGALAAPVVLMAKETATKAKKAASAATSKLKEMYTKADLATTKKNPSVKALKYYADVSKSPEHKAKGASAAGQVCSTCMHYKEPGLLKGTKEEVGKCTMFQNQAVHGPGWCIVYVKKPS